MNKKEQILELRKTMTYKEIGDKFGVSRQRIGQIVGKSGKEWLVHRRNEILSQPNLTNRELSELLHVSEGVISRVRSKTRHAVEYGSLKKGIDIELAVSRIMNEIGIENTLMPHHRTYDIETFSGKTIDVKSAYGLSDPPSGIGEPFYRFRVTKNAYCDYFIFVVVPIDEYYIVPTKEVHVGDNRITVGTKKKTKWKQYLNNWDVLR